ncbi:MAG: L-fucose/L-arabinose isomerase family protein [Desulfobacterales bacterium]
MIDKLTIGVVALARPTFDVPYAEQVAATAWETLQGLDVNIAGSKDLLFDAPAVECAISVLQKQRLDLLLVMQVTFSDATMTVKLADSIDAPVLLWSFPEPRSGGRLRLNSVCGINLAAHALARAGQPFSFLHRDADDKGTPQILMDNARAGHVKRKLAETRIGVIGQHPDGFDTCTYDTELLSRRFGVSVDFMELQALFKRAERIPAAETDEIYARVQADLGNLDTLAQEPLQKSLQIYSALRSLASEKKYNGLAVRCWPEMFTEFGCAACGPMAMMNQEMIPCACEADVYGTISTLMLQGLNDAPAFMTDMVDFNPKDNSAVFWHCGLAPLSMADKEGPIRATIHSNRKLPFLNEFSLKPGRITIARLSQSKNVVRLVIGSGEMIRAPMSFSGTSGVVRFDRPVEEVLETIIMEGIEHHVSMTYGDCRESLKKLAGIMDIPILQLT